MHLNQLKKRDYRRNKIRINSFIQRYNDRKIRNLTKNWTNKSLSNNLLLYFIIDLKIIMLTNYFLDDSEFLFQLCLFDNVYHTMI